MECHQLDDELHTVLGIVSSNYRIKTGISRFSFDQVSQRIGQEYRETKAILESLEVDGFVELIRTENGTSTGQTRVLKLCSCEPVLASPAERRRTHPQGTVGEGESEVSPGPKVPYAHDRARATPRRRAHRKPVEKLTSLELAQEFESRLRAAAKSGQRVGVNDTNIRALTGSIARWKREGELGSEVIFEMIRIFVNDKTYLSGDAPAWKVFLAQRTKLLKQARNRIRADDPNEDLGWSKPPADEDDDGSDLGW